jgi:transcription elongation factor Elf1
MFPVNRRGKVSGLARVCLRVLRQAEREGELIVVVVNEFYTSQVCSRCGERRLRGKSLDGDTMHAVQVCTNCGTVWQRDVNASRNLQYIFKHEVIHQERPGEFQRDADESSDESSEEPSDESTDESSNEDPGDNTTHSS